VPTPAGSDVAAVERSLRSFSIDGSPVGELDAYVTDSLWRFLHTWGLVRGSTGRGLELGANPYFTTVLVQDHTDLELTLANYFEPGRPRAGAQTLDWVDLGGEHRQRTMAFDHFDVEHERFPYDDGQFDVVLFCEIVEHLLEDPVAALSEINRVLAPGGLLVLTTPNVARLENTVRMVAGTNIYDPYSGFGPYGRHNREYTVAELGLLLEFCGFEVHEAFTSDSHPWAPTRPDLVPAIAPYVADRLDRLGHYCFVAARRVGGPEPGRPSAFYRSLPPGELVEFELRPR